MNDVRAIDTKSNVVMAVVVRDNDRLVFGHGLQQSTEVLQISFVQEVFAIECVVVDVRRLGTSVNDVEGFVASFILGPVSPVVCRISWSDEDQSDFWPEPLPVYRLAVLGSDNYDYRSLLYVIASGNQLLTIGQVDDLHVIGEQSEARMGSVAHLGVGYLLRVPDGHSVVSIELREDFWCDIAGCVQAERLFSLVGHVHLHAFCIAAVVVDLDYVLHVSFLIGQTASLEFHLKPVGLENLFEVISLEEFPNYLEVDLRIGRRKREGNERRRVIDVHKLFVEHLVGLPHERQTPTSGGEHSLGEDVVPAFSNFVSVFGVYHVRDIDINGG